MIKRFEIDSIEHLRDRTGYGGPVLEQHENVAAEPAGPTRIVEHHHDGSSLPGQFMKQCKSG